MIVAVQGCSHGSLSAIYDSIAQYESHQSKKVDLLLLCGDFQALRSAHDFASLAVPPKYHALGTFHEYYSGKRTAPVLTLVIGGNHEASNYMWELYHGGWLAENIYYLGAAGCVRVDGMRIAGASGIYKDHDYTKGHFETVPYNNSTMRSIYHIRTYDVAKLMQLTPEDNSIFLSHDWPLTIPHHGDTAALLRRKPFFKSEVQWNTLGSPPLLQILKHNQPDFWFSAHLHVKFAAVYDHGEQAGPKAVVVNGSGGTAELVNGGNPNEIMLDDEDDEGVEPVANPDEIAIDDGEEDEEEEPAANPNEIAIDEEEEAAPLITTGSTSDIPPKDADCSEAQGVIGTDAAVVSASAAVVPSSEDEAGPSRPARKTKFLALDKCGPGKDFIQFLDIPNPSDSTRTPPQAPTLTYDAEWLAITRVFHPYLSLDFRQKSLPLPDHMAGLVKVELEKIKAEGVAIPRMATSDAPSGGSEGDGLEKMGDGGGEVGTTVERGSVEVRRVQKFVRTAPGHGEPGGSESAWYTNPQTEALCAMLGIANKINPRPTTGAGPNGE